MQVGLLSHYSFIIKQGTTHRMMEEQVILYLNLQAKSKKSPAYPNQKPEVLTNQSHKIPIGILIVKLRSRSQVRSQVRSKVKSQVRSLRTLRGTSRGLQERV